MDEWVEVKGASVDVAVAAAMAELGIENREHADIEVLQSPEKGFLGIGRQDAIVRVKPRPKPKRKRSRNRRGGRGDGSGDSRGSSSGDGRNDNRRGDGNAGRSGQRSDRPKQDQRSRDGGSSGQRDRQRGGGDGGRDRARSGRSRQASNGGNRGNRQEGSSRESGRVRDSAAGAEAERVDINEQATVSKEFLEGLLGAFGLDGTVEVRVDDDVLYADIDGEQTEALIGPKATILQAIHELTKTVIQRKTMAGVRLRLDVGGYAERRREALTIYATRLAEQVIDEDEEIMLEPMNPADRKTVHDAVSEIEGVRSFSEGEDPRRSVVLAPDS